MSGPSAWPPFLVRRYGSFENLHPSHSRMTSMEWVNEAQESLLLTGSDDGVVRVWVGLLQAGMYGPENMVPPRLVTALHAAPVSRPAEAS